MAYDSTGKAVRRAGSSSMGLALGGAAAVLLVLLHISAHASTCEALKGFVPRTDAGVVTQSRLSGLNTSSAAPPLDEGVTYRPPIIDLTYLGGPVLWEPIRLYFVWYGTWTAAEKKVVRLAASSLTPKNRIRQYPNLSNLWSTVTQYYQEPQSPGEGRKYASNHVSIAKEIDDNYSFGHSIDSNIDPFNIIVSHIGHDLPSDLEQGLYIIFTSGDVAFSAGDFCGYHDDRCIVPGGGSPFCDDLINNLVYSFVPLASTTNGLINGCNIFEVTTSTFGLQGLPPNHNVSPNGALDSMIMVFLHELLETTVDPYPNLKPAYRYDLTENSEASDLCSYTFVAGDWYYCDLPGIYPDFTGVSDSRCLSAAVNHAALTDPKSHVTFNMYGVDGSKFTAQLMWSLANKGCVSKPEEACPSRTVSMRMAKGTIQRGVFFKETGLQRYAPGQNCNWKILVRGAKSIRLYFQEFALGYDDLDFVTVKGHDNVLKKKVTGFGKNLQVKVSGDEVNVHFVTYGGRSPYPSSAGFIMHYEAEFY